MARQRRVRIRDLVANANRTVNQASGEIQRTSNNANELIDYAEALLAEFMDGVTFTLVRKGEGTLMQFLSGEIDELPIGIKLLIEENDDEDSPA